MTTTETWEEYEAAALAERSAKRDAWTRLYADVPNPPDATDVDEWDPIFDTEIPSRYFQGTCRGPVYIAGFQEADGGIRYRFVSASENDVVKEGEEWGASDARRVAHLLAAAVADLLAAAEELERLEGSASTVPDTDNSPKG